MMRNAGLALALLITGWIGTVSGALAPPALAQAPQDKAPLAQTGEKRLGLVIGNGEYAAGALPTAANDAGLVAQTLQAAGFDVMGARDLDGDALRNTFRDFVDKVAAAGPEAVAFVYLSGHGLQYEGENFFVPIDARIERDVDVPLRALRLSDYVRPLTALGPQAVVVVLDAARDSPFAKGNQQLAGGLALVEPSNGLLYAFNTAPGTIAPTGQPPYSPYAQALAEMMREGGLPLDALFNRVRLRVHEATSGAEVPWHASQVKTPIVFFERSPDAPPEVSLASAETRYARPIRAFDDAREAYLAALERDTLQGYLDFLAAYPDHAQAKRVRAIIAARREAITWRRTRNADTPEAYWSYLDRYPTGPHAHDARRRLAFLTAALEPPPRYSAYFYDIPPPPPEEVIYVRRSVVYFDDPFYAFAPPPPIPIYFLPARPAPMFFRPPPPPIAIYVLPVPVFVPMPVYVRHPVYVRPPPPSNTIFPNVHRQPQPVSAPAATPPGAPPAGGPQAGPPGKAPGTGISPGTAIAVGAAAGVAAGAAAAVALPPSVQKRAATLPPSTPGSGTPGSGTPGLGARTGAQPAAVPPGAGPGTPPTSFGKALPQPSTAQPQKPNTAPQATVAPGTAGLPPGSRTLPGAPSSQPLPPPQAKGAPVTPPAATLKQAAPTPPQTTTPPRPGVTQPPQQASPPTQRQERIDRAQQDRGAVERQLSQDRQRDMQRRSQEAAEQARARQSQQQAQDVQRQRQQQMEAQRQQMQQQQRQQQMQQQQQAQQQQQQRQQQMIQQQQQQQQRQVQQQQQQAAQARAQAEAQARAAAQQQQQKRCGAPGLPPCPR